MDDLTNLARECDARWQPKVGDSVRKAAYSRKVMQRIENSYLYPGGREWEQAHTCEIVYVEQFMDRGYHPTHHSCTLAQWRTWAQLGHEGDRMYR